MRFSFSLQSILAALEEPFNPNLLIDELSKDQELEHLFSADAGVWEKYTIREHTLMVFSIFERFHAPHLNDQERSFFRLFLALHDIGKPLAIEQTGDKKNQSEFTAPILHDALEQCDIKGKWLKLAVELETHDLIGQYFKDQLSIEETAQQLKKIAERTGFSVQEVLHYMTTFFQSDAGAYTVAAGGKQSLDHLFEFEKNMMRFSSKMVPGTHFTLQSPQQKYLMLMPQSPAMSDGQGNPSLRPHQN
jgi:hypothetical protein